jgi:two-component system, chemotaxis family, sensor kinase CheA
LSQAEQDFLKKLRQSFAFEAKEQLQLMSSSLLKLEREEDEKTRKELVEVLFRQAHNLKGSARAVNMSNMESLCHALEAQLSEMKKGKMPALKGYLDVLLLCVDLLERLLADEDTVNEQLEAALGSAKNALASFFTDGGDPDNGQTPGGLTADHAARSDFTPSSGYPLASADVTPASGLPVAEKSATMDSIRLSAAKLDELLLQAEEMLSVKRVAVQHAADMASMADDAALWKREWQNIDSNIRALRAWDGKQPTELELAQVTGQINKLLGFVDSNHTKVNNWLAKLTQQRKLAGTDMHNIAVEVDSFLETTKKLLMMPCSVLLEGFPRLVREMSRDLGKEVEFTMVGTEVELDRRILARIRDPLVHLIRNSIDHGIEFPDVRRIAGKPAKARLRLAVNQDETGKVEVSVSDDGAGVDIETVTRAAIKTGTVTESEVLAMKPEEKLNLIFQSAVSTSPIITDISGRGLGLAIVKENVDNLGGRLLVETAPSTGTKIRIFLPVAIATFQGILLYVSGEQVAVPKTNLLRVLRLYENQIQRIEDKDAFEFGGAPRPLIKLSTLLEMEKKKKEPAALPFLQVAVVRAGDDILGLIVDDVLEEQEVMVKKLTRPLNRVRNIAGVTILRTGKVVPVLNILDLVKTAKRLGSANTGVSDRLLAPSVKKRVLVVDDTLTSRMLLKNIMEAAGYEVKTANDGVDAFAELNAENFHLVLLDVEMPRMDGLELTRRIREHKKLADLPVVLLTSLATREHRERGVQAGANAYFTKGSFDQTNLLDVIKRLI